MWKTFCVGSDIYMVKIVSNENTYKIYLSNFISIWSGDYSKDDIVNKFKEINPLIVVENEEAVLHTIKIINEIDKAAVGINKCDDTIDLKIKSEASGTIDTKFKLKCELTFTKENESEFAEQVMAPMVHTINYLEKQQNMLCDLIKKKDRELEEYKMEKGLISRTDLLSETFDPSVLKAPSDKLMLNIYGESKKFWEGFTDKYGDIEAKVIDVKVEPWNQVKRKRKTYNAKSSAKKFASGISYKGE